jgi:hypothetical protein
MTDLSGNGGSVHPPMTAEEGGARRAGSLTDARGASRYGRVRGALRFGASCGVCVPSPARRSRGHGSYYHAMPGPRRRERASSTRRRISDRGLSIPWAPHPPLWPLLLALPARLGLRTYTDQQLFRHARRHREPSWVVGRCAGAPARRRACRPEIAAAPLAAVYPNFFSFTSAICSPRRSRSSSSP